jgi:hypothetical protein
MTWSPQQDPAQRKIIYIQSFKNSQALSILSKGGPGAHKAFQPLASSGFCWLPSQQATALMKIIWWTLVNIREHNLVD